MPNRFAIDLVPFRTPWRYLLPIGILLLGVLVLVFIGFITVVRWLFQF